VSLDAMNGLRTFRILIALALAFTCALSGATPLAPVQSPANGMRLKLKSKDSSLRIDGLYYETARGRTYLPALISTPTGIISNKSQVAERTLPDGHTVRISVAPHDGQFDIGLDARSSDDILRWGFDVETQEDEYFTGLMERVVDGAQALSWAPGITAAMNLRGQKVDMLIQPTSSIHTPFYLSSRGYAVFVKGTWPGSFDFAVEQPNRTRIRFDGPSLNFVVYTANQPADLVKAHAMAAGPPVLPPKWIYGPWRWRDEHTQRKTYYDGTPVTGPFNSAVMEDVLMLEAFDIPNAVYWIDRPWGPGPPGHDDFEIDPQRLPHFKEMVRWLDSNGTRTMLWIAPFLQGKMADEDLANPAGKLYWQEGIAKMLRLGVAGFKFDRSNDDIPETGTATAFDGRSLRENRNVYPAMADQAAYEVSKEHRGNDFVVMPRAAYTGSSRYGVFWGGDTGGTQEGLRASIIAVQRAAVMGYPNWGSDTCGYNEQRMEQEVCGRWLAFSALTPIMVVGPTRNVAFWNAPQAPEYDDRLIALWRMYARIHERLKDYSYQLAKDAHRSGMPIVRPMFMVDPKRPEAWSNWWTYMYGPDLVVSPIWEKGVRKQQVYLPEGSRWRDAWNPDETYKGGQVVSVNAEAHQLPIFVRVGSQLFLGDLNHEWPESLAIARTRPNLKDLENSVIAWFAKNGGVQSR
jgi:alpha-D-xyloside xylohydrolase